MSDTQIKQTTDFDMTVVLTNNKISKKDLRKAEILKAARMIFEECGYEKAKVAQIAEKVGVVEGTVFHYFGSKQELVVKVMEIFYEEISTDLGIGLKDIKGFKNRLYFIIWFHFNVLIKNAPLCNVLITEPRKGLNSELKEDIKNFNRRYNIHFNNLFDKAIANGQIKKNTSRSLVRNTIYGSIESAMWYYLSDGKQINIASEANQLTDLIYNGISTTVEQAINKNEINGLVKKLNNLLTET